MPNWIRHRAEGSPRAPGPVLCQCTTVRLAENVALVTGSTRGIGRAIATRFAREGAQVVVTGRTERAGLEVEREIRAAGGDAIYVRTDLAREEDVIAAVRT